jgi:flagellar motor protein MotB
MLGLRGSLKRESRDEAEKPFWISFSDLMTALMVLFLVLMTVALFSVSVPMRIEAKASGERAAEIDGCISEIQMIASTYPGAAVKDQAIDFGTWAVFPNNSSVLDASQQTSLRYFVPEVLSIAREPICKHWLRQIIVEGFASRTGTYLHNLDLSTKRSERVLCALLNPYGTPKVTDPDRQLIQSLFFVGGSSFNTVRDTPSDSRRIELKLEFYRLHEAHQAPPPIMPDNDQVCPIDNK